MPIRRTQRAYNGYAHSTIHPGYVPISEIPSGTYLMGRKGGLYGDWINDIPAFQRDRVVNAIKYMIQPLDSNGIPAPYPNGIIGVAWVGMSHMMMESSMFLTLYRNEPQWKDEIRHAIFAESGVELTLMSDPNHWFWTGDENIQGSLASREIRYGVNRNQVQIIFLKQAESQVGKFIKPFPDFIPDVKALYQAVIENCLMYFPNTYIIFLIGRSYSGYDQKGLNPDLRGYGGAIAWGTNFVVQELLNDDINFRNPEIWPPLVATPDIWCNGDIVSANGLAMVRSDYSEKDGIHPAKSTEGLAGKLSDIWWSFIASDVWSNVFLKPTITATTSLTWRDGTNTNIYTTTSWTPSANAAHIAFIRSFDSTIALAPTSVTGNGLVWSKVGEITSADGFENLSVWQGTPGSGLPTNGTLTITFSAPMLNCTVNLITLSGADELSPITHIEFGEVTNTTTLSVTRPSWPKHGLNYLLLTVSGDSAYVPTPGSWNDITWTEIANQNAISPAGTLYTQGASGLTKTGVITLSSTPVNALWSWIEVASNFSQSTFNPDVADDFTIDTPAPLPFPLPADKVGSWDVFTEPGVTGNLPAITNSKMSWDTSSPVDNYNGFYLKASGISRARLPGYTVYVMFEKGTQVSWGMSDVVGPGKCPWVDQGLIVRPGEVPVQEGWNEYAFVLRDQGYLLYRRDPSLIWWYLEYVSSMETDTPVFPFVSMNMEGAGAIGRVSVGQVGWPLNHENDAAYRSRPGAVNEGETLNAIPNMLTTFKVTSLPQTTLEMSFRRIDASNRIYLRIDSSGTISIGEVINGIETLWTNSVGSVNNGANITYKFVDGNHLIWIDNILKINYTDPNARLIDVDNTYWKLETLGGGTVSDVYLWRYRARKQTRELLKQVASAATTPGHLY